MIHQNESSKTGSKNVRQSVRHFHQDGFSVQLLTNTQIKADKYRFLYWCHGIFLIVQFNSEIGDPSGPVESLTVRGFLLEVIIAKL